MKRLTIVAIVLVGGLGIGVIDGMLGIDHVMSECSTELYTSSCTPGGVPPSGTS
jgi:hypothetical protein